MHFSTLRKINLKLSHKALILVAVPLVFEAVFFGALLTMLRQTEAEVAREEHAKQVMISLNALMGDFMDASKSIGLYIALKEESFLNKYSAAVSPIPGEIRHLRELLKDDPNAQQSVDHLEQVAGQTMSVLDEGIALVKSGDVSAGLKQIREVRKALHLIDDYMGSVRARSNLVAQESPQIQARTREMMKAILVAGLVFNVLLAISLAVYFNRGTARRLALLMDNTRRLARGDELNPPVGGGDEIAHLDQVFREMSDALELARQKELAVIENAEDVICTIDFNGTFAKVSPASVKVWGYAPEELTGRNFTEIISPGSVSETAALVHELMNGRQSAPFESKIRRKDGTLVDILWSAHWSEGDKSLFCVAHDITDRKLAEDLLRASEARVRLIVESMPVGLVITDQKGAIQMINPTTAKMFGYEDGELADKPLSVLFTGAAETDGFMEGIAGKAIGRIYETDAKRKSGQSLPVQLSLTAFQAIEGQSYLAVILDITERKEIERLKQEFVAMISHDLRTPLTSIQIFLNMLTRGAFGTISDSGLKKADMADRNATRLINLVNDLLDIEKLESGQLQLHCQAVTLKPVIERSVESVRGFAEQQGVTLAVEPISDGELFADSDRLVQVVVNLLGNAVKFSPKGSVVTVSTNKGPEWLELRVTDRGRGVPAHLRETIFERFKQVEARDATEKGGTGLGLAICKAIVEQHGGQIGVESQEGQGSSFWFRLPLAKTPVA